MKELRKTVGKTKIDGIKSQQIRKSCVIQLIIEQVEIIKRKLDEHVTRMDAGRLVKISGDKISAEDLKDVRKQDGAI